MSTRPASRANAAPAPSIATEPASLRPLIIAVHEPGKPGCAVGRTDLYNKLGQRDREAQWLAAYDQARNGSFHGAPH